MITHFNISMIIALCVSFGMLACVASAQESVPPEEFYQLPEDGEYPSRTRISSSIPRAIDYINNILRESQTKIASAPENVIMLKCSPFRFEKLNIKELDIEQMFWHVITLSDGSSAVVSLKINKNAESSLATTVFDSAERLLTSRPSTWQDYQSVIKKDSMEGFHNVNFVSFFYPKDFANAYVINSYNVTIHVYDPVEHRSPSSEGADTRRFLQFTTAQKLVNSLTQIFDLPEKKEDVEESKHLHLKVINFCEGQEESLPCCELEWSVDEELHDCWILLHTDIGKLSIVKDELKTDVSVDETLPVTRTGNDGQVLVSDIPETGCILTVYAISPDGKTWYKKELMISGTYRLWKSAGSNFETKAKFISVDETSVTLEQESGRTITVDLERLSSSDREYVKQRLEAEKEKDSETLIEQ